jgi:hypothetical protein
MQLDLGSDRAMAPAASGPNPHYTIGKQIDCKRARRATDHECNAATLEGRPGKADQLVDGWRAIYP